MVYFVGAGPGAPDLITVRGQQLLQKAQLVIYAGSLVNPELLKNCPADCVVLNSASMTLDQVIAAIEGARGQLVVRLHTGDPSIYGAIREQMDRLRACAIPFVVVPGVSAFSGAAAALEAELTLPGVSQSVILTRMAGRTQVPAGEELEKLAAHRATMALYLSAAQTREVCRALMDGGYPKDTPAAIVYKATWPDEKIVRGTLETLPERARGIDKTALIVVGNVLSGEYELSKLYDPAFSHGFREGTA
ncbi:MAG: precorrin-4 C(11)-methyltransferase [Clostridia bacterium]